MSTFLYSRVDFGSFTRSPSTALGNFSLRWEVERKLRWQESSITRPATKVFAILLPVCRSVGSCRFFPWIVSDLLTRFNTSSADDFASKWDDVGTNKDRSATAKCLPTGAL